MTQIMITPPVRERSSNGNIRKRKGKSKSKISQELIDGLGELEWRAIKLFVDCRYRQDTT